ncbi:MAG: sn-glycerol-3-phosphate import ATP-binding protein UgpC [Alphaproteobacteria bacterium]|nr:sn-glycerol-3-phosphate import ATP-binding protein UgpC [Alphaproteobacteria bacterium]
MAEVRIAAIQKSFGDVHVLHGIDTTIADGEFMVLLGPSGCGKSTLLRIVAGLEVQSSGDVLIGGRNVNEVEPKDRNIAMVFQNYALYPHMSVYDNMAYGLRVRGMAKGEIETRVQKAAKILELAPLLQRKPRQLSGGQRQRVAMGRAIVRDPQVFLFDEPLSNLDAKLRVQMRIEIKRLHQTIKTTSIYVTHDQVEAMTLADRLIVMNTGHAEQIGSPLDVYAKPATTFVASFIGAPAMNLLAARAGGGAARVGEASLPLAAGVRIEDGREIVWGVRPEHIGLAEGGAPRSFDLDVDLVEALGADTLVHGRLPDGAAMTVRMPGTTRVREGDRLPLALSADAVHVFDKASGRRL